MFFVNALCREVTTWSMGSDQKLRRIFGYLKSTTSYGILWRAHETHTLDQTIEVGHSDSDHAGDNVSMRSTSGWLAHYASEDQKTWVLVDWNSRRQGAAAKSTAEAEVGAINDAMLRSCLPLMDLLCIFQNRDVEDEDDEPLLHFFVDADAARIIVTGRRQTSLAHLRRHQRFDLAVLRDLFVPSRRKMLRKPGEDNFADALTKAMKDAATFIRHREAMGLVDINLYMKFKMVHDPLPESAPSTSLVKKVAGPARRLVSAMMGEAVENPEIKTRLVSWALRKNLGA